MLFATVFSLFLCAHIEKLLRKQSGFSFFPVALFSDGSLR